MAARRIGVRQSELPVIRAIDVECPCCGAVGGAGCRDWSLRRRNHRVRSERMRDCKQMHRLAMLLLFDEWPLRKEVELIAMLGADDDDRQRAAMLLTLVDRTGYDGELY